jgi:anti-anti-sigma regulatory factor
MRRDQKEKKEGSGQWRVAEERLQSWQEVSSASGNVVFDFTGLRKPDVADLALILTARLKAPLNASVWLRAIDPRTARVLCVLGLDHLFRVYPRSDEMN